jgi:hypothetical protein
MNFRFWIITGIFYIFRGLVHLLDFLDSAPANLGFIPRWSGRNVQKPLRNGLGIIQHDDFNCPAMNVLT